MEIFIYILKFVALFWCLSSLIAWIGILLIANFSRRYKAFHGMDPHAVIIIWPTFAAVVKGPYYMVSVATLMVQLSLLSDKDIER